MIYFNNGATTLIKPDVVYETFLHASKTLSNMGRGVSTLSIQTSREAYETREVLAHLFSVDNPLQIGFAKNATEALNAGIYGLLEPGDHVISTVCEHNSVLRPLARMERERGVAVSLLPCDSQGRLDPDDFVRAIRKNTKMIVMSHVSNVSGNVFDIRTIGKDARERGILFFLDTAQSAGVLDIDCESDCIDLLAFTAHKYLFGLQGLGGLYLKKGIAMKPLVLGGGTFDSHELLPELEMPELMEAGTQNMPGIAALRESVRFVFDNREAIAQKEAELTRYFLKRIVEAEYIRVLGNPTYKGRVALFSLVSDQFSIFDLAAFLDEKWCIETRLGLHCAPLIHRYIGSEKTGTLRISFCYFNEKEEIDVLMDALREFPKYAGK